MNIATVAWLDKRLSFVALVTIVLLFISATVKQSESFFEGDERYFSSFIETIAAASNLLLIVALATMTGVILKNIYEHKSLLKTNNLLILFILVKLSLFFSLIYYGVFSVEILFSITIIFVFSYFIITMHYSDCNYFNQLTTTIGLFGFIFVFFNYYEMLNNPLATFWKGRFYGVTNHPNFLGGYSAMLAPFALALIINTKGIIKLLPILLLLSLIYLVLISGSRSSLAILIFGIAFWSFVYFKGLKTILISAMVSALALVIISLGIFQSNDNTEFARLFSTENTRSYVITELWSIFSNNPIIGNPLIVESTSNSYLAILANGGLLAGILMLFLLIIIFTNIYLKLDKNLNYATYSSVLVIVLLDSIFEGILIENFSFGQLIFIVGLIYIGYKSEFFKKIAT